MEIPIIKSKLIMPELSQNFLITDRLNSLHEEMKNSKAVSIYAPAGYGKTTLAVSYFTKQPVSSSRVCWYRLDPEDANLSIFINHLSESVFPSENNVFNRFRNAILKNRKRMQKTNELSALCREMWSYHSQASGIHTYIVLDDFQNVSQVQDSSGIHGKGTDIA